MSPFSRRSFLQSALTTGLAASVDWRAFAQDPPRKPNIVFIMADDLGYSELGCYGNSFHETPNLDRLASQGMRFNYAYAAAPVCSPTRASIMTGQFPARVGILDYLRADDPNHLSPNLTTLAEPLRDAGYATGMAGKWHLMGDYTTRRGAPQLHGFDEVICSETTYIGPGDYFAPYDHLPGVQAGEGEYLTDRLGKEAAAFIERHADEPFFFYLSFYSVHRTLAAPEDTVAKYKAKPGAGPIVNNPILAAMIEHMDTAVGRVMTALDDAGIADDTLVVFFSDNGGDLSGTTNAPLRAGKSYLYEGGIREPMIVRWPGKVEPGATSDVPVCSVDFMPTFHNVAGVSGAPDQPLDGVDLSPVFTGTGALHRDTLCWHYPLEKPHTLGGRSAGAIRHGDWKLIHFYDDGHMELYNLAGDPGELKDRAAEMPEIVRDLRDRHDRWLQAMGVLPG